MGDQTGWDAAARRAGQIVLDRFLDEDMGATLGVWPRNDMLGEDECGAGKASEGQEGCWRWVVGRIAEGQATGEDDGWSRDLWKRLGGGGGPAPHGEL